MIKDSVGEIDGYYKVFIPRRSKILYYGLKLSLEIEIPTDSLPYKSKGWYLYVPTMTVRCTSSVI